MTFKEIVEQDRVKQQLLTAIEKDMVSHAYLFLGEEGIGKYTMAKAFAEALLCSDSEKGCGRCSSCKSVSKGTHPDLLELGLDEHETSLKISQIRQMITQLSVKPYQSERRIAIIRGGDRMTTEAQNALLKSLEEPERFNIFIITANDAEGILQTIRSRCQVLTFEPISPQGIRQVLTAKGYTDQDELETALYDSEGSIGKALEFFENRDLEALKIEALDVFYAILRGDICKIFDFAEKISKDKRDSLEVLTFLIVWFHDMALVLTETDFPKTPYQGKQEQFAAVLSPERNDRIVKVLFELMDYLDYNVNLRLQWESAMLKI